jgi:hypothetical protein
LTGDGCDAPGDALGVLRPLLQAPMLCSRERPFGIHRDLSGESCPRCGWTPRRRRTAQARTLPLTLC